MAPSVFHADGGQSAVYKQPEGDGERLQALQAVLSCPT
jgi:ferredoxin